MTPPPYLGRYINLDRSPERRERIERQLADLGLAGLYRRFAATDGGSLAPRPGATPGERGCFHSHMTALKEATGQARPVHIVEDDAILSRYVQPTIELMDALRVLSSFDLIFTEMFVPPDIRAIKAMKSMFDGAVGADGTFDPAKAQVLDLAGLQFSCTSSYVVNPASVERMVQICQKEWDAGPTLAYDMFLRREVHARRLKAACIVPFVTSIDLSEITRSTISGRTRSANVDDRHGEAPRPRRRGESPLVMALLRYSYFVGRDLAGTALPMMAEIRSRSLDVEPDTHRDLIEDVAGYIVSDHFRTF